jgi:hypothetical protein
MPRGVSTQPSDESNPMHQGDLRLFNIQSQNPSSDIPYGLSLLHSVSQLNIQQESDAVQSITF